MEDAVTSLSSDQFARGPAVDDANVAHPTPALQHWLDRRKENENVEALDGKGSASGGAAASAMDTAGDDEPRGVMQELKLDSEAASEAIRIARNEGTIAMSGQAAAGVG